MKAEAKSLKFLENIRLYRITHINNIEHILKFGITHKKSKNANKNYVNIGDSSLIYMREEKEVFITNGGDKIIYIIKPGDFIPFYFGVKMPMLYVIQNGGNFTEKVKPSNIVYLVCSLKKIIDLGLDYYFSDGHIIDKFTTIYDKNYIDNINKILDWNAINSQYWGGEENLELKRKKQAEFLVKGDLPVDVIIKFICYDEEAEKALINFGIEKNKIEINKDAYF